MHGFELFTALRPYVGEAVFHGSPHRYEVLAPRQCVIRGGHPDHTQCGVYASAYPPISLLYALIHEDKNKWGWNCDFKKSNAVNVTAPDPLMGGPGYLYVLPKTLFATEIGEGVCCVAYQPVIPIDVFEVHPTVLKYLQKYYEVRFSFPAHVE
jgi:hypothetical protein